MSWTRLSVLVFGWSLLLMSVASAVHWYQLRNDAIAMNSDAQLQSSGCESLSVTIEHSTTTSIKDSPAFAVNVFNKGQASCSTKISVLESEKLAVDFDTTQFELEPDAQASFAGILRPKCTGTHSFIVRVAGAQFVRGIAVMNAYGFSAQQWAWITLIGSGLGTFLGPLLTIDFWINRLSKKSSSDSSAS